MIIGKRPITVGSVSASVTAPQSAAAGSKIKITWQGPNNPRDFITIVKAGTPDKQYGAYEYTSKGSPVEMRAPDVRGRVRSALSHRPDVRHARDREDDRHGVDGLGQGAGASGRRQYVRGELAGAEQRARLRDDREEGRARRRLRQLRVHGSRQSGEGARTGRAGRVRSCVTRPVQAYATLARAPITITPAKEEPGLVEVTAASALPAGSAVEIILDASGSMLQKIGKDRRIDIARQTLTKLVTTTIPAGTPFAFRVFGRMEDSCQSDLDVPLGPLNVQAVSAQDRSARTEERREDGDRRVARAGRVGPAQPCKASGS